MIKFTVEMEATDVVEIMKGGVNMFSEFEKQFKENEAWIRGVRERVVGTDRADESFEEMQGRIKKEIEESKRNISGDKELGGGLADSLIGTDHGIKEEDNRDVEEAKDRIKKRVYGAQQNLKMEDIKDIKFEDLCTHKSGKVAAINSLTTEGVTCSLCNKKFKLIDQYDKETKKAVDHINNVVETLKLSDKYLTEEEIIELVKFQSILNTLEDKMLLTGMKLV